MRTAAASYKYGEAGADGEAEEETSKSMLLTSRTIMKVGNANRVIVKGMDYVADGHLDLGRSLCTLF